MGPYLYAPGEPDPAEVIRAELERLFPLEEYPDFLFVFGSALSAEVGDIDVVLSSSSATVRNTAVRALGECWRNADGPMGLVVLDTLVNFIKNAHAYPLVEVRNRAFVLGPGPFDGIVEQLGDRSLTTEKYFDSNEDFLLWDVTGKAVITEQMAAYPILDLSGGDFKADPSDPCALFRLPDSEVTVGVEICLDHSDYRLRRTTAISPWPKRGDGIDLHLIPSCGMQLHPASVAARAGGWAFNVDGQYALGDPAQSGTGQTGVPDGVPSAFTDYVDGGSVDHAAHTQLARIARGPHGANVNRPGSHDATFEPAPEADVTVLPVPPTRDVGVYFAGGPGAVHIYGCARPLPL